MNYVKRRILGWILDCMPSWVPGRPHCGSCWRYPAGSRPGASGSIPIGTGAGCTPGVIPTGTVSPWPATVGRPPSSPPGRRLPSTRGPPSWRPGGWGGGRRRVRVVRPRHSAWRGTSIRLSDLDWLVLDIDFKPEGRAMSHFGAGYRDRLLAAARAAGCPIFSSTSGNGAHILARLAASADRVDLGRSMTLPAAGDPALTGLTVDRFLPGAKALVCVRFERPMSDITPDVPVPVLSPRRPLLPAGGRSFILTRWGDLSPRLRGCWGAIGGPSFRCS